MHPDMKKFKKGKLYRVISQTITEKGQHFLELNPFVEVRQPERSTFGARNVIEQEDGSIMMFLNYDLGLEDEARIDQRKGGLFLNGKGQTVWMVEYNMIHRLEEANDND